MAEAAYKDGSGEPVTQESTEKSPLNIYQMHLQLQQKYFR
jgi:hypothetical protein